MAGQKEAMTAQERQLHAKCLKGKQHVSWLSVLLTPHPTWTVSVDHLVETLVY